MSCSELSAFGSVRGEISAARSVTAAAFGKPAEGSADVGASVISALAGSGGTFKSSAVPISVIPKVSGSAETGVSFIEVLEISVSAVSVSSGSDKPAVVSGSAKADKSSVKPLSSFVSI